MVTKKKDQGPPPEQGQVTVTAGREVYAPVAFHSFEVGPLSVTTDLQSGETFTDAYGRANTFLMDSFEKQFESKMEMFFKRLGRIDEYMIANNMVPRAQADTFRASSSKPAYVEPVGEPNEAGWVGDGQAVSNELGVTSAQISCMQKIADKIGIDVEAECERIFGCQPGALKKPAMSKFLDYINDDKRFPKGQPAVTAAVTNGNGPAKPELSAIQKAQVDAGTLKIDSDQGLQPGEPPMRQTYSDDDIPF